MQKTEKETSSVNSRLKFRAWHKMSKQMVYPEDIYDLDAFRDYIFEQDFEQDNDMKPEASLLDKIKKDDTELLKFSINWLKAALLRQK